MNRGSLALALAIPFTLFASIAHADDAAPVGLSLSVERVAGIEYASIRPTGSSSSNGITTFGIAGPAVNPIGLPRVGVDVLLPMGLTLGGALGVGHASLSNNPDGGQSSAESATAWLVSPRVGYLLRPMRLLDIWPRAGLTFAGASLQAPDSQSQDCTFMGGVSNCTTTTRPGDSTSFTFIALSIEVTAALRLTRTFNLLGGLAYDHVVSASGSSRSGGSSTSSDTHAEGKYLGPQLWFGLGGYVL